MANDTPVRNEEQTFRRGLESRLKFIEDNATKDHKSISEIFKTLHERSDRALDEAVEEVKAAREIAREAKDAARAVAKEAKDAAKEEHPFCLKHDGFKKAIEKLEDNVTELWKKFNRVNAIMMGFFITSCATLIGVVLLLLRTKG